MIPAMSVIKNQPIRVAAIPYHPQPFDEFSAIEQKLTALIQWLADEHVQLAVFPEYAAMELAAIDQVAHDLAASIDGVASYLTRYHDLFQQLAVQYDMAILAGSVPVRHDKTIHNTASLFSPAGLSGEQQKLIVTRYEREQWHIDDGHGLRIFDLGFAKVGINICYDIEFPLACRAMCEAGAELILCPSCTDTDAGYQRVLTGARARALENQCFVVLAPLTGSAQWCPAIDENVGTANVIGPSDVGFPADGIVASGLPNDDKPLIADIDLAKSRYVRHQGAVLNFSDWARQPGAPELPAVELTDLAQ